MDVSIGRLKIIKWEGLDWFHLAQAETRGISLERGNEFLVSGK